MTELLKQCFGDSATDEIISSFKAEIGKRFVAKGDFNAKRDELANIKAQLEEEKLKAEALRAKAEESDRLTEEMAMLKEKYVADISDLNGRIESLTAEEMMGRLIRKSGGRNERAVRALLSFDGDTSEESVNAQLNSLKKSDPYLFDLPSSGVSKGNFPRGTMRSATPLTYSQMLKLEAEKQNF